MNTSRSRRQFLRTLAATAASLAVHDSLIAAERPKRKPNFIIFFTDDQGYNDIGCFGSPLIRTPNFDRIGDGARFFDPGPKRPDMNNWKKKKK